MTKLNFNVDLEDEKDVFEIIPVKSSNITGINYNEKSKTLTVVFKNGTKYFYFDVPWSIYEELMGADSIGKFFHSHIKGVFKCEKG